MRDGLIGVVVVIAACVSLAKVADATGLPRGGSRFQLNSSERETPRDKPVASLNFDPGLYLAANAKLHGASPWHLLEFSAGPQTRTPQRQTMTRWVGKYPDAKFFAQPQIKGPLRRILTKADFDSIGDYNLMIPIKRVGDYLVTYST